MSYDGVAGPEDLIRNGENGFLVDLFDDVAFGERLSYLMTNEEQRRAMAVNSRRSVAHLSSPKIARKVLDFMQDGA